MSTYLNKAKQTLSGAPETTEPFYVKNNGRYIATLEDLLRSYSGQTILEVIEDIESARYPTREERMAKRERKALLSATSDIIGGNGHKQTQSVTAHEVATLKEAKEENENRRTPSLVFSPPL